MENSNKKQIKSDKELLFERMQFVNPDFKLIKEYYDDPKDHDELEYGKLIKYSDYFNGKSIELRSQDANDGATLLIRDKSDNILKKDFYRNVDNAMDVFNEMEQKWKDLGDDNNSTKKDSGFYSREGY